MSKGVVLFAFNNDYIDYIKQAVYCAKRVKKYLNLPVQVITDDKNHLEKKFPFYKKYIDTVTYSPAPLSSIKIFNNGLNESQRHVEWKNSARDSAYDLSIFDKTIVLDTDLLISNNKLLKCFDTDEDFMIVKEYDLIHYDKRFKDLDRISNKSIHMYWATIIYFKKSNLAKIVFDLVQHIKENYNFYRLSYEIIEKKFRNDFAFSIAIHMMRGFTQNTNWPITLPTDMWISLDKDILVDIKKDSIQLLAHRNNDYISVKLSDANTHVMNKFSLDKFIDKEFTNE
jgi:predicted nucleic acid-binding protein